jgi:hypothetical protein
MNKKRNKPEMVGKLRAVEVAQANLLNFREHSSHYLLCIKSQEINHAPEIMVFICPPLTAVQR